MLKHANNWETLIKIGVFFCTKESSDLLEKGSNFSNHYNNSLRVNCSRRILFNDLSWETLQSRRDKHKLILFYTIINCLTPQYVLVLIQPYFQTKLAYNHRSFNFARLFLIEIALSRLHLNYGMNLMHK